MLENYVPLTQLNQDIRRTRTRVDPENRVHRVLLEN